MKGEPVFTSFDDYNYLGISMNNTFSHLAATLDISIYDYMINILEALKEGKDIQYRTEKNEPWIDHNKEELPRFVDYEYRIKPKIARYKVGLFKDETGFCYASLIPENIVNRGDVAENIYFIKWLTDWIEHDTYIGTPFKQRDNIVSPKY